MDNVDLLKKIEKMVESFSIPLEVELNKLRANRFQTLIAIMLSARTKDTTTASVLKGLFQEIKKPSDLSGKSEKEIEHLIYPVGFYKTKARNLIKLGQVLQHRPLPKEKEGLLELPGIGPKTANLYLSRIFSQDYICVDIHVHRISNRLFLDTQTKTPEMTEKALEKIFPKKYWQSLNSDLVKFGQNICLPRNPKCSICLIRSNCRFFKQKKQNNEK